MPATEQASCSLATRSRCRSIVVAFVVAALLGFYSGYAVCDSRMKESSIKEARRQFLEFLRLGIELGFVTVDRQRLDELVITMAESEWEAQDAEDRQRAMSTTTTTNEGR